MERRIVKHSSRLQAALDVEFRVGQRVRTLEGYPGRVLFLSESWTPGDQAYVVELDSGQGKGTYLASQLRPVPEDLGGLHHAPAYLPAGVTAALDVEADLEHLASEDYPEMGDVLHERPDPGRQIMVIGAVKTAADDNGLPPDEGLGTACDGCGRETLSDRPGVPTENYRVHDHIWQQVQPARHLCIGCVEHRLGRTLNRHDFPGFPVNDPSIQQTDHAWSWRTPRLHDRLTRGAAVEGHGLDPFGMAMHGLSGEDAEYMSAVIDHIRQRKGPGVPIDKGDAELMARSMRGRDRMEQAGYQISEHSRDSRFPRGFAIDVHHNHRVHLLPERQGDETNWYARVVHAPHLMAPKLEYTIRTSDEDLPSAVHTFLDHPDVQHQMTHQREEGRRIHEEIQREGHYKQNDLYDSDDPDSHNYGWCHTCKEHHDSAEEAEEHDRVSTDWRRVYKELPSRMYRGLAMRLTSGLHEHIHDPNVPVAERARMLDDHLRHYWSPLGMHWTRNQHQAEHYAEVTSYHHKGGTYSKTDPSITHVVIHAAKPRLRDIERDPDTLEGEGVIGHEYHEDQEIPMRGGAPVRVTGLSWKKDNEQAWTHHQLRSHHEHVAMTYADGLDPREDTYNGEPEIGGIYWQSPAQQAFVQQEGLDDPEEPAPVMGPMLATTISGRPGTAGTKVDDHGDAPGHGSDPDHTRAANPDAYDAESTEGQGDPRWSDPIAYAGMSEEEVKKRHNGAQIGAYPEGISAGGGPGLGIGGFVASSREEKGDRWWEYQNRSMPGTLHRGIHVELPDDLHEYVHDESQPAAGRAHALASHFQQAGLGLHWTPHLNIAHRSINNAASGETLGGSYGGGGDDWYDDEDDYGYGDDEGAGPRKTDVIFHASQPGRRNELRNPQLREQYSIGWQHGKGEDEFAMKSGTPVRLQGVSWKLHEPEYPNEPYEHVDFDQPVRHEARVPWTGHERTELHAWQQARGVTEGDFVPSSQYTNRHPVPQPGDELMDDEDEDMMAVAGLHSAPEPADDPGAREHLHDAHAWPHHVIDDVLNRGMRLGDMHEALHDSGMANHTHGPEQHHEQVEHHFGPEMGVGRNDYRGAPERGGHVVRDPWSAMEHSRPYEPDIRSLPLSKMNYLHHVAAEAASGEEVYRQLSEDYPPEAIGWVRGMRWSGPEWVPFDRVDWAGRKKWTAYQQPDKVDKFARKGAKKKEGHLKPSVSVQGPDQGRVRVGDGHHRALSTLLRRVRGEDVPGIWTWVAHPEEDEGPWDEMHGQQIRVKSIQEGTTADTPGPEGTPDERRSFQDEIERGVAEFGDSRPGQAPEGGEAGPAADPLLTERTQLDRPLVKLPAFSQGGTPSRKQRKTALAAFTAAAGDSAFRFEFTASWHDVQAKAARMRREGKVTITRVAKSIIIGEVIGDHATYEAGVQRYPGRPQGVMAWICGCPWATFHQNQEKGISRFAGRMCSHAYAVHLEAASRSAKNPYGTGTRPDVKPWNFQQHDVVVWSYPPYVGEPQKGHWEQERIAPAASKTSAYITELSDLSPAHQASILLLAAGEDADDIGRLMRLADVAQSMHFILRHLLTAHNPELEKVMPQGPDVMRLHQKLHQMGAAMFMPHRHEHEAPAEPQTPDLQLLKQADQANAPWGSNNYVDHPPAKPYGATSPPEKDRDPGSYGPLAGPDPDNWGEIQDGSFVQNTLTNESALLSKQVEGPDTLDWIPEHQESFPYSDQANTSGPSTSITPRDPNGIRMEESWQDQGEPYRQAAGIDGTAGDAQDVAHGFVHDTTPGCGGCLACGLSPSAAVHHHFQASIGEPQLGGALAEKKDEPEGAVEEGGLTGATDGTIGGGDTGSGGPDDWGAASPALISSWGSLGPGSQGEARPFESRSGLARPGDLFSQGARLMTIAEAAGGDSRRNLTRELLTQDRTYSTKRKCPGCGKKVGVSSKDATVEPHDSCPESGQPYKYRPQALYDPSITQSRQRGDGLADGAQHPQENITQNPGMGSWDEPSVPADQSIQTIGQQQWSGGDYSGGDLAWSVEPHENPVETGADNDPVAQFQRSAAARQYAGGGGAGAGGDIAAAARAYLSKTAEALPADEADELIREGRGTRARNLDLLRLEGTHYVDDPRLDDAEDDVIYA